MLPDKLEAIGSSAFYDCSNISGSLIIPEGVTRIGSSAFSVCNAIKGKLSLPSTLKYIGTSAFERCDFTCELIFPNILKYWGQLFLRK